MTVLDHAIFQFELKKVKNLSDTHLTSQFPNGKHWTRELLWLAGLSTWGQKAKVYNVLIRLNDKGRPSLSRSKSSVHVNNRDNQPYVEVIWYRDRGDRSQCNLNEIIAKVVKINKFEKLDSA